MKKTTYIILTLLLAQLLVGCDDFLDAKPTKAIVLPNSVDVLQNLLDNNNIFNRDLSLGLLASNEFQTDELGIQPYEPWERNSYLWQEQPFGQDELIFEWYTPYNQLFYVNNIISELEEIQDKNQAGYDQVKGAAHFFRANAYFNLAQLFLPPLGSAEIYIEDYQIAYKISELLTFSPKMADVGEIYELIFADMTIALEKLPEATDYPSRPNRAAAHGLMSRIYLAVEEYGQALAHAESALGYQDELMDFNQLDSSLIYPIQNFNPEILYYSMLTVNSYTYAQTSIVDSLLYNSYQAHDLRKSIFYTTRTNGNINFTGNYTGNSRLFSGVAVNELLLISAECNIRMGNISQGLDYLNRLLIKRYEEGYFEPIEISGQEEALRKVLSERKKELAFRGLRWSDLRRLNTDPRFEETLIRKLDGQTYTLQPNSDRYIFPIPPVESAFFNE
ncbi:RagB/SusD family nutrient uptake outer membrane protein [Algoriphagus sp. NG3]|uniref:RagB/SusD family nutrient uptake outer membrane protein n=1 Tax=Algoriphagus sp. NG3 TaxID=3097546 RepID=UPI002A80E8B0|nr:RagB/SusD family nutrient uptake outer membrane protein [Algoriphagus sp. NG3]WPR76274.1 RagB/SusD family nutrient uptake outer membrane protein [Algoriphagus sp. NG3]